MILNGVEYDIEDRTDLDLITLASMYSGAIFSDDVPMGRPAADFDWAVVDFPISDIEEAPDDWSAWMRQEIADAAADGSPGRYGAMFDRPIQDEVVLVVFDGKGYLWDGYHRTGAEHMKGSLTVRAAAGTPRFDYSASIRAKGP